ncbi:hypothetical protein ACTQ6A_14100 [Lachnospiraceae bacterium LCP25S3_G4]
MKIHDIVRISNKVTFVRVEPEDLSKTLLEIIKVISDLSWIKKFDEEFLQDSFEARALPTVNDICMKLENSVGDEITSKAGEYVVSELSREVLYGEMKYSNIPLSELYSKQISGNPGFDFHSENMNNIILFGEAKYLNDRNAYGTGLKQIVEFVRDKKDLKDLADLRDFCSPQALKNAQLGFKGYAVGFAAKSTDTKELIINIQNNSDYQIIEEHNEVVLVAVNI